MPTAPIFIVGTERSGSNLLRLILNAHREITVPHPPHIMAFFAPLERYYGDLSSDVNFHKLADDVLRHIRSHIHPWPTPLDRESLVREAVPRDLFGLFAAVYEQHSAAVGKRRWGCKSTFMIHYTERIFALYPDAQLLWLVRDPRDVALSSRDSVFNPYHPYYTARLWASQQELGLRLAARLSPANLLRVHYEALIADPGATVAGICDFLDIGFDPAMLKFFETEDARVSANQARDWRNTASPIISDNANKFRGRMPAHEIAAVESAAGAIMLKLGYEPVSAAGAGQPPGALRRAHYQAANEMLRLRAEYHSLREDRNQWLRWRRRCRIMLLTARLKLRLR
ncbi:MAG TPA: sulfotransferase [Pyrinomonadaceae bacterium]|nr:sulfotransferase [Pyrinomonadaceae bacterium]